MGYSFKVGDTVVYTNQKMHDSYPRFYPAVGTVGKIEYYTEGSSDCVVRWERGSTSDDDRWWIDLEDLMPPSDPGEAFDTVTEEEFNLFFR